jgi:hypothetical protein
VVAVELQAVTCRCDGSGKISYKHVDDRQYEIGEGLIAGPWTTWGSHLCECRRELPPREGQARWWTTETVYSSDWSSSVFRETAEITVQAEVPVSEDNYVVHRRGNRYYPCSVDLNVSSKDLHFLFPEEARELARMLVEAADKCDEIDLPDCDEAGAWWFPDEAKTSA